MQENPESQEKKVIKENFFEAPGVPKAESKEEPGARSEEKTKMKSVEVLNPWKQKNRKKVNLNLKGNLKLDIPRNPGQNLRGAWKKKSPSNQERKGRKKLLKKLEKN